MPRYSISTQISRYLPHAFVLFALGGCSNEEVPFRAAQKFEFNPVENAVIFLVDTLRNDHLGCYGYERAISPRIDAFAAEGLLFERCIAQSTWTKPASASVLTGLYPSQHGMTSESAVLPLSVENIAGLLSETPLATGAFVGNQYVYRAKGEMLRGFDFQQGFHSKEPPSYARAEVIVDAALEWIEDCGDEPFFVYIHTVDPHAPYGGTEPFASKFISPGASELSGDYVIKNSPKILNQLNEADRQQLIDLYDGDIAYTDHQFGRFLDRLDELGHKQDTLVIFTSDHGEEFKEHGSWLHNSGMHPEVINIPLILRMPDSPAARITGRRVDLCAQVDLLPTVFDALGMGLPPGLSGRSLFSDPGSANSVTVFSEIEGEASKKALVSRDFKYIRQWSPGYSERLFDLRKDPQEMNNIAWSGTDMLSFHRKKMEAFIAQTNSGYSLLFQNPGPDTMIVDCYLSSRVPFDRVKLFYADTKKRHGELRDGPPQFSNEGSTHKAHIRLHVLPVDGDGVRFSLVDPSETVRVEIKVNGELATKSLIRMGLNKVEPNGHPLELEGQHANQWVAPQPLPKDKTIDEPYRILLWTNLDTQAESSPISVEERESLEALGYAEHAGDD